MAQYAYAMQDVARRLGAGFFDGYQIFHPWSRFCSLGVSGCSTGLGYYLDAIHLNNLGSQSLATRYEHFLTGGIKPTQANPIVTLCGASNSVAPCRLAITSTSSPVSAATILTPNLSGTYQFCGSMWVTAAGVGTGAAQLDIGYQNPGASSITFKQIGSNISLSAVAGTDNFTTGVGLIPTCATFTAAANVAIQLEVTNTGTFTTFPTVGYSGALSYLSN